MVRMTFSKNLEWNFLSFPFEYFMKRVFENFGNWYFQLDLTIKIIFLHSLWLFFGELNI